MPDTLWAESNELNVLTTDSELAKVRQELLGIAKRLKRPIGILLGDIVRQAIDEVVDGPRTGRWDIGQLTKTEKTYIGTKVEIIVRNELDLDAGQGIDTMVAGVGVDIKWSQSLAWMIGRENVGRLCLGLGLESDGEHFSAGLFRASISNLRSGRNQDKKASLTAEAMASKVSWLAKGERLPADFVARLDPKIRDYILKGGSAQERLSRLARRVPGVFIPRHAICTIARNNDPLRRTRRDSYRESPLGDMAFLSTKYGKDDLHRMGYKDLPKDHWIAVPLADLP